VFQNIFLRHQHSMYIMYICVGSYTRGPTPDLCEGISSGQTSVAQQSFGPSNRHSLDLSVTGARKFIISRR
jgi:hypothetical protein